ncbi:MAG TPA: hypothetical protein PLX23_05275 [Candidatus Hydrogenedens sp.]|nr:hypothetical protein [Candidatus Hydrogenedens sp.]
MRYLLVFTVVFIALILIITGIKPDLIPEEADTPNIVETVIAKKASNNISKLSAVIKNCIKVSEAESEKEENKDNKESIPPEEKLLRELELIIAYQNAMIARFNFHEVNEKSLKRAATPVELQKAHRDYESAELYFTRLLEKYPEGVELFK